VNWDKRTSGANRFSYDLTKKKTKGEEGGNVGKRKRDWCSQEMAKKEKKNLRPPGYISTGVGGKKSGGR